MKGTLMNAIHGRVLGGMMVGLLLWVNGGPVTAQVVPPAAAGIRGDRILVKPKPGMDLAALHTLLGTQVLRKFPGIGNLQVVQLPAGGIAQDIISRFQLSGLVVYAEPDFIVTLQAEPDDFRYTDGTLWSLHNTGINGGVPGADIDAPAGWDTQKTADNVIVAVIDTGVRFTHEDLATNMWTNPGESGRDALGLDKGSNALDDDNDGFIDDVHGINAILGTGLPLDDYGHGTHVAGIVGGAGNNSVGVAGVCWRVQLMACKFLDAQGHGSLSDAITCIDYARRKGAKIINASWGDYSYNSTALRDAIDSARLSGIIFVAACGNDNVNNDTNPLYPASFKLDNIVAVAATTRTDDKAAFSNYGATNVHLGAPGDAIFSCWNGSDSDYRYLNGTSMAAPHVAGVCALVWARHPSDNYRQVINRVLAGTEPLPALADKCVTGGRLNLPKALSTSPSVAANFTASPSSGTAPLSVRFTDASTGPVARWQWSFGDGSPTSTNENPVHVFDNAGTFIVTLTVSSATGATSSKSRTIQASAPSTVTADFTASPSSGPAPLIVQFTDTSTGDIAGWFWDFGDGMGGSADRNPSHAYATPGTFTARLTVTASNGSTSAKSQAIRATTPLVGANFTTAAVEGGAPLTVQFTDASTGPVTNRFWNFGDGSPPSRERNPVHTYPKAGSFKPSLKVFGLYGKTSRKVRTLAIRPPSGTAVPPPLAGVSTNKAPALTNTPPVLTPPFVQNGLTAGAAPVIRPLSFSPADGSLMNQFQFQIRGHANDVYLIQSSTDLVNWTVIATNEAAADGTVTFTDAQAGNFKQRFYRGLRLNVTAAGVRNDRILVKPKLGLDLSALHRTLGVQVLNTFPRIGNLQICQVPLAVTADALILLYQQSGLVAYAEHDFTVHALVEPNDFRFTDGSLWNFKNTGQLGGAPDADIDAPEAWDTLHDANNVIVALIDTGIRTTHEDLAQNLWTNPGEIAGNGLDDDGDGYVDDVHGINTLNNSGNPEDDYGHGSHVSGTIGGAGNNSVGVVGVCWKVQIMACKFLNAQGDGSISDAIKCIDYARTKGARVMNASWGSTTFNSQALQDAIVSARNADIIFVAASGNSSADNDDPASAIFPASYDTGNIIAVAATTRTDTLADFSNYGANKVDLAAPGSPIFSCWNGSDSDYQYFAGTSMAAAHVSGAVALLRAKYPNESYLSIINRILDGVDPVPALAGKCRTGGRLNLQKAIGSVPPPPGPTVTVTATDADASESGDTGTFTVNRTGSTAAALTVNYSLDGTASNGVDYQPLSTSVTIPTGSSSATITVAPIDDSAVEGSETVVLTLSAGTAYAVGSPGSATVVIADDDQPTNGLPVITLSEFDPNASESGSDAGVIRFHRTGDTSQAIQVSWTFSGSAVNGSDFQQLPTSSPFPAGLAEADLTITPIDDTEVEGNETVIVTLVAGPGYTVGSPNTATVTIADNDQPPPKPTVTVTATDANAAEAGDTGTFTISRTDSTATALTVNYTLNGTAGNGTDYQQLGNSVTIAAGASSATVTVTPIDDSTVEANETVVLTLSADASYDIGSPSSATVTIADNDQPPPPTPTVTVTATDANASESGDTGTFTVNRTGGTTSSLTVNYALSGTAQNGSDYQSLSTSVTVPAGSSSATITVTPIDDSAVEANETVVLTLSAAASYNVGSPSSATVNIADNDQPPPPTPTVTVTATDANASESGDTGTFTVNRTGSTTSSLTVNYALSGTAQNGSDYQSLSTSVTIPASSSSATITVTPIDDSAVEANETVVLTLSAAASYNVGSPSSATVTIADNDQPPPPTPTVTVTATDASASESGDTGTFTVNRTGSTTSSLTVNYALSGTAQNGSDYQSLSTSVTIPAGSSSATITVTPIDDSTVEANETVVLTLSAGASYNVGSPSSATVNIADNDQPPPTPTVTVTATDANASESGDTGTFTVNRTGSTTSSLTVNYALSGTAQNGSDYQSLSTSVTIPAGSSSATITVTPIDDSAVEANETVVLTLSAGASYNVGSPSSATVTIADNDQPPPTPTVTVTATDANASESGDTGTFTVNRTGGTTSSLTVNYALSGTAQNGSDYQQLPGSVTIPVGASSANITVTPIDDSLVEGSESVVLTLSANAACTLGSPSSATVTIADNDQPPPPKPTVTVTATDANASESGDTGTFTVGRTGSTTSSLTVNYSLSGTAQNGSDYQQLPGSVTIPAGASSATITVTPVDDSAVEGSESVVLTLSANAAYTVGSPDRATVTIADNDQAPRPIVSISVTIAVISEGGGPATCIIHRTGSTSVSLTVRYSLSGTAINGTDYERLSGTAVIPAGADSVAILVKPIDDRLIELAELAVITLEADASYDVDLSLNAAVITITDNDLLGL